MRMLIQLSLAIFLLSIHSEAAIFGTDDRRLVAGSTEAGFARSVAIAVLSTNYETNADGSIKLLAQPLSRFMCSDEKFANEMSLDYSCTGFLVGKDLLATAGHCVVNVGEVRNATDKGCQAYAWLFDHRQDKDGAVAVNGISAERIYKCKQIIYGIREEKAPYRDFALIQLEKEVTDGEPLRLANAQVGIGQPVAMISHPFGTAAKVSTNAHVLLSDNSRESFITNLDAVDGDSGSPVFGNRGVLGILIGGTPSQTLITDQAKGCQRVNKCSLDGSQCDQPDADLTLFPGFQRVGTEVQKLGDLITIMAEFEKLRSGKQGNEVTTHSK